MNNSRKERIEVIEAMHTLVIHTNNDNMYYGWINIVPDCPTEEDFEWLAEDENEDIFQEAAEWFIRNFPLYMKAGGLYVGNEVYPKGKQWDM